MRKFAAILLLIIYSFNLIGYKLVFHLAEQASDNRMQVVLDASHYNEKDLITLKVPLDLPYQNDWKEFERVDGEIRIDGKIYKYVKRKVEHGQLVLLCLPDENKMHLESAKDDFFKLVNDYQQSKPAKKSGSAKVDVFNNLIAKYHQPHNDWSACVSLSLIRHLFQPYACDWASPANALPDQPPESGKA